MFFCLKVILTLILTIKITVQYNFVATYYLEPGSEQFQFLEIFWISHKNCKKSRDLRNAEN